MPMSKIARGAAAALGILFAAAPGDASAETTEYQVTFESTWSQATHPLDFPPGPHFSGLIGGTHTDQVSFWSVNTLASLGIKNMAELGDKTALMQEVQAAITAGTADAVLSGGGIGPSPGSVVLTFDVDDAFPFVTLVSMLAPSPDWFVGVSALSLRENGAWIPEVVVDLAVYDAGTDSGPSYTSPNQATMPPVPVAENTTGPFATNNMVGTFTFTRTSVVDVPPGVPGGQARLISLGPNPLRHFARFQVQIPGGRSGELAVYGVGGQRIRGLFHGDTAGRSNVVRWNGRDDGGALVPAGVYFVALSVDGAMQRAERVVVVR
jgi:Spondin_N